MGTKLNLEELNIEDYKKYFFPRNPFDPWREQILFEQIEPPPCNYGGVVDAEIKRVSLQLRHALLEDENHYKTPLSEAALLDDEGKVINLTKLLFPKRSKRPLIRLNTKEKVTAKGVIGKYVLICCFFVPELWDSSTWEVALACHELYAKLPQCCEVVIVAKMRGPWSDNEAAFNDFLSAFPPPCLVVPFHDKDRIHYICDSIAHLRLPRLYLVAPSGEVLIHNRISLFSSRLLVPSYRGSTSPFPFISQPHIYTPPSSLEQCLCTDSVLRMKKTKRKRGRPSASSWHSEVISISHFHSTHVMLYLYTTGDLLPLLTQIDTACKNAHRDFEIVILYLPSRITLDPQSFIQAFGSVLSQLNLSWCLAPLTFTAFSTLGWFFDWDKLVIVGPNDQFVDPRGAEVLKIYGLDYYPFTFSHVVDITVNQLEQVTLNSLLPLSCKPRLKIPMPVLLYFDFPSCIDSAVYDAFFRFSKKSNMVVLPFSLDPAAEVESHLMNRTGELEITDYSDKVKWFYCDAEIRKNFFLRFFNREFPTIVAFGKDGKIRSVLAHSRLPPSNTDKSSPIKGSLRREVSLLLDKYYSLDVLEYLIRYDLALVTKAKQNVINVVPCHND